MRFADLHLHTNLSDGRRSPVEIVELAAHHRLDLISTSDHDNIAAYDQAFDEAVRRSITLVPGVELSVAWKGVDVHLLAWAFDPTDAPLLAKLSEFRSARDRRGELMVERLVELDIPISLDDVQRICGTGSMGRPHVGQALIDSGVCSSMDEAFDLYLSPGRPGFIPKARLLIEDALELINNAGGVTSIAHPVFYPNHELLVPELLELGVDGVEVLHPEMPPDLTRRYDDLCVRMGKMRTGGSDDHGFEERRTIGSVRVPLEWIEPVVSRVERFA